MICFKTQYIYLNIVILKCVKTTLRKTLFLSSSSVLSHFHQTAAQRNRWRRGFSSARGDPSNTDRIHIQILCFSLMQQEIWGGRIIYLPPSSVFGFASICSQSNAPRSVILHRSLHGFSFCGEAALQAVRKYARRQTSALTRGAWTDARRTRRLFRL